MIKKLLYALLGLIIIFVLTASYLYYVDVSRTNSYLDNAASSSPELYELECREAHGWEKFVRWCIGWDK